MKALALIDIQNDFIDGSMGVGMDKFSTAWKNIEEFIHDNKPECIITTFDSHPMNHCSFKEQGGPWPVHCAVYTHGMEFYWKLQDILANIGKSTAVCSISKGRDKTLEEYGVDTLDSSRYNADTDFDSSKITEVHVMGLCTDYCVKECAIMTAKNHPNVKVYIHTSCSVAIDPNYNIAGDVTEYPNIEIVE